MSVEITGAKILFELPFGITITETQVVSWGVMLVIAIAAWWLGRNLKVKPESKRQVIAEYLVTTAQKLVRENMTERFDFFAPFIGTLLIFSVLSSLSSLLTFFPPTADINNTFGWALVVFILVTYYKIKTNGFGGYLKSFAEPIVFFAPLNVLGELSTPVSMGVRHFGNVASGMIISTLLYAALASLSSMVLGWLPGFLGEIPLFQIGIPAILSLYFDLFSGCLQAFIFCMLTMVNIKLATGVED